MSRYGAKPIAFTAGTHLSISLCMKRVVSSGVIFRVSTVSCARCLRTLAMSIARLTSRLSRSTMSRGRPAGPESAYQVVTTSSGYPSLHERRHLGQFRHARGRGDRERAQRAGADMGQRGRERHAAELHLAGDKVEHRGTAATIGDVHELELLLGGDVFGDHVADRTEARRNVFDAGRRPAHQVEEIAERHHRRGSVHDEDIGRAAQIGDVGEIAHRVESGVLRVHRGRQHVGRQARRHQRVAVGGAARDGLGADKSAAAGAVLDEELLAERGAQRLGKRARQDIGGAAGAVGDDDAHRLYRPFRSCGCGERQRGECGRGERDHHGGGRCNSQGSGAFHCGLRMSARHNRASRPKAQSGMTKWLEAIGPMDARSNYKSGIAYDDLREWLAHAERLGEVRIVLGATWQEDIGLAAEAVLRAENGPCVLFEDIPGCPKGFRLLMNVFAGTRRNMTLGFPDHLTKWELSEAYRDAYLKDMRIMPHELVETGPVFENVMTGDDIDVLKFPAAGLAREATAAATSAPAPTASPATPKRTGSMPAPIGRRCSTSTSVGVLMAPGPSRLSAPREILEARRTAAAGHGAGRRSAGVLLRRHSRRLTACSSSTSSAACAAGRSGWSRARSPACRFPANAEIVLEGYVTPDERREIEGPFGEWTGHYAGGAAPRPVLDIKAIYHRNDPILLGVPPMGAGPDEMARYRAVLRSAMVKQNMANAGVPDVQQVWCHEIGGARMLHGISIKQQYPGHAVQAGQVAAQCGASAYASKYVVVVDEDVDVTNLDHLLWAMLTRTDPKESIQFITGSWDSPADPRAAAGAARGRQQHPFGRRHRCLQAVSLARQVSAQQCAERRGRTPGAGEIRLAARRRRCRRRIAARTVMTGYRSRRHP